MRHCGRAKDGIQHAGEHSAAVESPLTRSAAAQAAESNSYSAGRREGALASPSTDDSRVGNGGDKGAGPAAAAAAGGAGQGNGALADKDAIIRAAAAGLRPALRAAGVLLAHQRALGARAHGWPPA